MTEMKGDLRFRELLDRMWSLHCRKACDYGAGEDNFANLRASEAFGIPAWLGTAVRMNDKMKRIQSYVKNGFLANEGVEDSLLDLSSYALLALILFQEQKTGEPKPCP